MSNPNKEQKSSTFMETLQDKLKDIKNFSNWSAKEQMVAVTAVGVIFGALLPVVAVALPVAAAGAAVALTLFFAVKAVEYAFKGLKWSAEKTVKGAEYTAGKIKAGAVRAKDSVKEGYENSVDLLKSGASLVGEGMANKFHRASGKTDYLDKIKRFTPEEIKKSDDIRKDMKEIFADKESDAGLVKSILSEISSRIDLKIEEKTKLEQIDQTFERLLEQGKFISGLSEKSLYRLLTERSLPKDTYLTDSVFSEHYDEIKKIIKDESARLQSLNNLSTAGEAYLRRSRGGSASSTASSLKNSLSPSSSENSLNFVSDNSETPLLPEESSNQALPEGRKVENSTFYVDTPVSTEDAGKTATVDPTRLRRNSSSGSLGSGSPVLTPDVPPKAPESPTSSRDSGINSSGPSTPEKRRVSLTMEDIKGGNPQGKLRKVDLQQQASQIPVK